MIHKTLWRITTILIVLTMVVPLAQAAPVMEQRPAPAAEIPAAAEPSVEPAPVPPTPPGGDQVNPLSKLDSELRALVEEGGEEPVLVYVLAKPGTDLGDVADVTETRPMPDGELVVAEVEPGKLAKLASNPDVVAAEKFQPIPPPQPLTPTGEERELPSREEIRELREQAAELKAAGPSSEYAPTAPTGPASPGDWYGKDLIGASAAWAKGYTGAGVNIAILDSGVDFGHPDLQDRYAVYEDGPYEGWPIALDPRSMRQYVYNGRDGWDNYDDWWDYTWYAGVYDVILHRPGVTETFDFNGYTYHVASHVADMSRSGEIRWSVHPDEQLADFVWDWTPFILLDTETAGVYDTVIADLNFDLWFDQHDDAADKDDPILAQDLGAYLTEPTEVPTGTQYVPWWWSGDWRMPPTWWGVPQDEFYGPTTAETEVLPPGTWVWAPNHWTPDGAYTVEDGVDDVSGGMVYYIADGVNNIPAMDYLYPTAPTPLNGQLVAFMIGSVWAGGGDHGTLCASAAVAGGQIADPLAALGERVQFTPQIHPTDPIFSADFSDGAGDWDMTGLWHLDVMTDTFDPPTFPPVYSPTVSFNRDGVVTPTYGTVVGTVLLPTEGSLSHSFSLPEADEIELSFWSYEETESRPLLPTQATQAITVGVVGGYSTSSYNQVNGDPRLASYTFVNVGNNFTITDVVDYDALLVDEHDQGLTTDEALALYDFYSAGKPIIMGMDDFDDLPPDVITITNEIFGVTDPQDRTFTPYTDSLNLDHPMSDYIVQVNNPGGDNDHFTPDGAVWVVQDADSNYYVLSYEGAARTVIMGEALNDWYDASNPGPDQGRLVVNALIWAVEYDYPLGRDPDQYDVRSVEISTDGSTWYTVWDSTGGSTEGVWYQQEHDISNFAGLDVTIRFRFDTMDELYNDHLGWYVDNVEIVASGPEDYLHHDGIVQGPAPGAKIIAIGDNYEVVNGMQGFYDAYAFLAYGVDGEPNSGDEFVDIVSMSYGDGSVHNDGWDYESRLISYYNQQFLPHTTFFASSGNGGHGFGTVNSPQGNTTVSVGASTQYGATDVFGGGLELAQLNDGEVQPFSGRGPDAYGRPDPDVTATGAWGAGNTPVNLTYGYGVYAVPYLDGGNAWYEWGGTSRSAPEAAGVMALVYQAYYSATNTLPTFETAREILMSGADDLNHDVLMQGAGRVNADRATDVAGGHAGVYVSPSLLAAGEYDGTHYESFANVLYPGDTWTQTFTVYNSGSTAATVDVGDEVLLQTDVLTYSVVVSPYLGTEDPTYPNAYYQYANYFVVADPTAAVVTNTNPITPSLGVTYTIHGDSLVIPVPPGADLMQVQLVVPFELFDFAYNDPDPDTVSYNLDQRWSLTVYDWDDRNGDGKLWLDGNDDGIVNPQAVGDPEMVDVSFLGVVTQTEINRFAYSYNYAAEQEVTVRLGDRTDVSNVVLGIVHRYNNDTRPGWGADEYQEHPLQVKVVFYEKADWELVDTPDSLVVPAPSGTLYFGDATFDATFTIPQDQAPGLYEGAITVDDGAHTTLIPVTVNVAVPPEDLLFTLGDAAEAGTPYDNGRTTGGWTWYSVYEEGDWRFFYYDADAGFEQQYLYVRNQWGKVQYDMPTAYETLVWGPNPGDSFSKKEPGKYGPYGLRFAGGTWDAYGPQDGWGSPRRGTWWVDGDGITRPENRVWATLWDGLNQVQFRNILNSGKQVGEDFDATAGVFGVDADVIVIEATEPSGSFTFDAVSPVDGLWVEAKGFVEPEWFRGLEALVDIPQGTDQTNFPPNDLLNGWVHEFEVQDSDYVQADLFGPWASDADLYLLFDQNHDGIFAVPGEVVAQSTLVGSNENIFYADPLAGDYAVVIYGYDLRPGDLFDLRLETGAGASDGLVVEAEEGYWYEPQVLNATPGVPQEITVHWEVPGTGLWEADVDFCMPWDENPRQPMGPCIDLDVVVNYGGSLIEVEKEIYLFEGTQPMTQTVYSEDLQQWLYEAEELLVKDVDELEWMDLCTQPIQGEPEQHIFLYHVSVTNNGDREVDIELHDILPEGTRFYNARWQVTTEDWTTTNHMRGNPIAAAYWGDGSFADHLEVDNGFLEIVGGGLPFYHLQPKDPVQGAMNFLFLVEVDRNYSGEIVNTADVYVDVWLPFTQYHTRVSDSAVVTIYDCQTLYLPLVVRQ